MPPQPLLELSDKVQDEKTKQALSAMVEAVKKAKQDRLGQ
jgi:hypothetical protein